MIYWWSKCVWVTNFSSNLLPGIKSFTGIYPLYFLLLMWREFLLCKLKKYLFEKYYLIMKSSTHPYTHIPLPLTQEWNQQGPELFPFNGRLSICLLLCNIFVVNKEFSQYIMHFFCLNKMTKNNAIIAWCWIIKGSNNSILDTDTDGRD